MGFVPNRLGPARSTQVNADRASGRSDTADRTPIRAPTDSAERRGSGTPRVTGLAEVLLSMSRSRLSRPCVGRILAAACFETASTTGLVAMLTGDSATTPESRALATHSEESGIQTSGRSPESVFPRAASVAAASLETLMTHGVARHARDHMADVAARRTTVAISGAAAMVRVLPFPGQGFATCTGSDEDVEIPGTEPVKTALTTATGMTTGRALTRVPRRVGRRSQRGRLSRM